MKKICVLGLGYIGLPTACMLANNDFDVLGIDVKDDIIRKLNSGLLHISEKNLEEIFLKAFKNKKLRVSNVIEKADVFIITVPTPLNKENKADLSFVINAANDIKEFLEKDNLVILESTSPPGTTENIVGDIIFKHSGLKAGTDYHLAFCPERVLPGNLIYELINNDRIVGGINDESAAEAKKIYESFVKGKIFITDLKTAEIIKLVENTYRDINLAFANELSLICEDYDINVWEVIKLANMHPRVNVLNPGPGVGGHCIPIDPWFILENIDRKNTLIEKSREINDNMPFVVLTKIENLIKNKPEPKITLLGASYKENVGDTRESPTEVIYHELIKQKIEVSIFDPVAENFKYELSGLEESVKNSDLIVLLASHDIFRKIDYRRVYELMRTRIILDTRNFFECNDMEKIGFEYYK